MKDHKALISGIQKQLKDIFDSSQQAIYIYLDDANMVCNAKFSLLLGYKSPDECTKVKESFLSAFVAEQSQAALIAAYRNAMEKRVGSQIKVTWKKKSGETIATNVILVPIAYGDHLMALHFISPAK